jgi:hypothetical protein
MILFEEYRKINDTYFNDKPFEISNLGNIKNTKTGNIRTPFKGRIQIESTSRKTISVARMVALTFLTEKDIDYSKRKVKHIDGDINNNHVDNLAWL